MRLATERMTKSVRAESETKWVVRTNVSNQQYKHDKDGTGYSDTGGSREKCHWLGRSSVGVEMDRVTNHRSMWGMVRASRLEDISELDWWGIPQSSGHLHIDFSTSLQWLPLLVLSSLLVHLPSVPIVRVTSRTGRSLPSLNTSMPTSTWYALMSFSIGGK